MTLKLTFTDEKGIQVFYIFVFGVQFIRCDDGYYKCYECIGGELDDPCWETKTGSLNNINEAKCEEGCYVRTRVGNANGHSYNEIERGCINVKSPLGCTKSVNITQVRILT